MAHQVFFSDALASILHYLLANRIRISDRHVISETPKIITMIIVIKKIKTNTNHSSELHRTLLELSADIRKMKGCISALIIQNLEDENIYFQMDEWKTKRDLNRYLNSGQHNVFMGAMKLLSTSHEVTCNVVHHREQL